jgi:hypothetical protein
MGRVEVTGKFVGNSRKILMMKIEVVGEGEGDLSVSGS